MSFAGTGMVISWNDRGYGFIRDDTDKERDLFVHAKDARDVNTRRPEARVRYGVVSTDRGFQAVKVQLLPDGPEQADECDVLTEEEFLAELRQIDWFAVPQGLVSMARKHGWVDG